MDQRTTATLEKGMRARQNAMDPDKRCKECDGCGHVPIGCAITHSIYGRCSACGGTGRKAAVDAKLARLRAKRRSKKPDVRGLSHH